MPPPTRCPPAEPDAGADRVAWVDATFGIAGDMLLAALIDAGANVEVVRAGVAAVLGDAVRLDVTQAARRGRRATAIAVRPGVPDQPHRPWRVIRDLIRAADLPARSRDRALEVFRALARAEGRVHGVPADEVAFHEVGAWDSISDVVGVCVALEDLGVAEVRVSSVALGEGTVSSAHGLLPVPGPAVLELLAGSRLAAHPLPPGAPPTRAGRGGEVTPVGELATPTGVALLVALADGPGGPPRLVERVGVGAGRQDTPGWANVTRVVLGPPLAVRTTDGPGVDEQRAEDLVRDLVVLETTVDDLDPRAWPSVLAGCLAAGALDAWLVPALGKKGRPAHVLAALLEPDAPSADGVRNHVLASTGTLGFREYGVRRTALGRVWQPVVVSLPAAAGGDVTDTVRVKVGLRGGRIVHATPEYEDCAALAARAGRPVTEALDAAGAAAHAAGCRPGAPAPGS